MRRHPHPDPPPQAGEGEQLARSLCLFVRQKPVLAVWSPLPLAGEGWVGARHESRSRRIALRHIATRSLGRGPRAMRGGLAAGAAVPRIVRRRLQAGARAHAGIAAVDRGIEQFRQRRPDRLHVRADGLWISGFCRAFWECRVSSPSGEYGMSQPARKGQTASRAMLLVALSAGVSKPIWNQHALRRQRRCRGVDDIQMNPAATGAAHGPVFGAGAAGDDAQDRERGAAIRAGREHRRRLQDLFGEGQEIRPAVPPLALTDSRTAA